MFVNICITLKTLTLYCLILKKTIRSSHSGHNGAIPSSASMQGMGQSGGGSNVIHDSDISDNCEHLLNNNLESGIDMCDVPDHVANQKRQVSIFDIHMYICMFKVALIFTKCS